MNKLIKWIKINFKYKILRIKLIIINKKLTIIIMNNLRKFKYLIKIMKIKKKNNLILI